MTNLVNVTTPCANLEEREGVRTKSQKNKGFLSNTELDPLKIPKATIQCWTIIGRFAGGSIMARLLWYLKSHIDEI